MNLLLPWSCLFGFFTLAASTSVVRNQARSTESHGASDFEGITTSIEIRSSARQSGVGKAPHRLRSSGIISTGSHSKTSSRSLLRTRQETCEELLPEFGTRNLEKVVSGAIISNGLIKLGVTEVGSLNVPGGDPTHDADRQYETEVGLRYIFPDGRGEGESTSYACNCEGWGAGADGSSIFFNAGNDNSPSSDYTKSFEYTDTTAISTVQFEKLKVTHDFHPHPRTRNLYEVTVTIENISEGTITDVPYRRVMDWDIYPFPFYECITIQPDPSLVANFVNASNDGFLSANPYKFLESLPFEYDSNDDDYFTDDDWKTYYYSGVGMRNRKVVAEDEGLIHDGYAPFKDLGPQDQGATLDFQFGPLNFGASVTFQMYFGAAGNEEEAQEALGIVAAEVYSIAKPADPINGGCKDTPNTYLFAFASVGGEQLFTSSPTTSRQPSSKPSRSSEPSMTPQPSSQPSFSRSPSRKPSDGPTDGPTASPTASPTKVPSKSPLASSSPTYSPLDFPTFSPTLVPTGIPTDNPTNSPTGSPTDLPTTSPTRSPTASPTKFPTNFPTRSPIIVDSDADGLSDGYETAANPHTTDPNNSDTDGDGLSDYVEDELGSDPNKRDTDGDGLEDGYEVNISKTNPLQREPTKLPKSNPTKLPTPYPTSKPTRSPTTFPSVMPSIQPSFVEQIVQTTGTMSTNEPFCSYSEEELRAFTLAVLQTIAEFACPDTNTCIAEITTVCGNDESRGRRQLSGSSLSRKLQAQNWQVEYLVTEIFTCERSTCSSPADRAKVSAIVDTVTKNMNKSMGSGKFREVLSVNLLNSRDIDPTIVECMVVWGTVRAAETKRSVRGGEELGKTGVFYPDWDFHSGTCLQDGNEPEYMANSDFWVFDSLEDCCSRFYPGWNYNKCINPNGSGLWYADHITGKCATDCEVNNGETCGGLANLASDDLYFNPKDCCEAELFYRSIESCEANSLKSNCFKGTGFFYRGDTAGVEVCVKDCDRSSGDVTCGGIVEDSYVVMYETAEKCCSAEYLWIDIDLCMARTTRTPLGKYWPDKSKGKCSKDDEFPTDALDVEIFDSIEECCEFGIPWLTQEDCYDASDMTVEGTYLKETGSNHFYIDWINEICVKDCHGPAPCGGLAEAWDNLYVHLEDCCAQLSGIPKEECVYS